jgi:hypothetical protein
MSESGASGRAEGGTAGGSRGQVVPGDPAALELLISERRDRLAATVDELVRRTQPREIARRGAQSAVVRLRSVALTPDGQLRVERVGAVVAATVTLLALVVWRSRRSR